MSLDIDREFVARQRERGFSWQAIALQVRVHTDDLRRLCDISYGAPLPPCAPVARPDEIAAARERRAAQRVKEKRARMETRDMRTLATLAGANGCWVLPERMGGQTAVNAVSELRAAYGRGIIESEYASGYRITTRGMEVYRQLLQQRNAG